jgi:hypothetical protein
MKWLLYLVGVTASTFSVCGNEIDVDLWLRNDESRARTIARRTAEPEEIRFQRDSDHWKWFCLHKEEYHQFNHFDLTSTKNKLLGEVTGDPAAEGAMDIFLASFYWRFVDYCVGNLQFMNELNQQRFKEILTLLAPGLVSTRYMAKAVNVVGRDQREVRAADIQYLPFCLDMFFYAAVRNGQLGRRALAQMCINAFHAPCLNLKKDDRFRGYRIVWAALENRRFDDWPEIRYFIDSIWPNWR